MLNHDYDSDGSDYAEQLQSQIDDLELENDLLISKVESLESQVRLLTTLLEQSLGQKGE